jgi:oligopeptide transport system ATP-binding protein
MSLEKARNFLRVKGLKTHFPIMEGAFFPTIKGTVKAVDGVDLDIAEGEVVGLVGESGCGKSTLGKSIMRLVQTTEGSIELLGVDLASLDAASLKKKRPLFQMIFQDPYASLDPRMTVFDILAEPLIVHKIVPQEELTKEISRLMEVVGLAPRFMKKYPHEFSGGQRQRISIARALALRPKFIIADEPVSALDVSIQSQILNLLMDLKKQFNLTLLFISHDLSVIRYLSDRVAVMYLGKIVELGKSSDIFENPQHPYTKALLSAIPSPDPIKEKKRQRILLDGDPPSPMKPPSGCAFHPRCRYANDSCKKEIQTLKLQSSGVMAACHRIGEI